MKKKIKSKKTYTGWKNNADRNNDGVLTAKERKAYWKTNKAKVSTILEKKYDKNDDGWLQPVEIKDFLKDRYLLIKSKGKAKAGSLLEKPYDTDSDGIIDPAEAKEMREDFQ